MMLGLDVPAAAENRQARADALRSIAFDASAELELRAAFAARASLDCFWKLHRKRSPLATYGAAIVTIRQIYPQLESRPISRGSARSLAHRLSRCHFDLDPELFRKAKLDPMLDGWFDSAGVRITTRSSLRRECLGLMQLHPKTARRFAKQAQSSLFPLPAFRARLQCSSRDHLSRGSEAGIWQCGNRRSRLIMLAKTASHSGLAGQTYREPAEFVDSIPFTETREYVEIVTRNAGIYRKLYGTTQSVRGAKNESRKAGTGSGH